MNLAHLIGWYLPRFQAEIPNRTHSRDIADDGAPALAYGFEAYVTDGERGKWHETVSDSMDICNHPTLPGKGHCPTCDDTGLRIVTRQHYRRPMKRALAMIGKIAVPAGRPKLDTVAWALALADGNWQMAAANLSSEYACMADPGFAGSWTYVALLKLRSTYREDVSPRELRRVVDNKQATAEAA